MMTLEKPNFSKSLNELFDGISAIESLIDVNGLAIDSREVKPGDLFMAYRGTYVNGIEYIDSAIKAGAVAIAIDSVEKIDEGSTMRINARNSEGSLTLPVHLNEYNNPRPSGMARCYWLCH